ncbi:homoserine kinase [Jeotgalibacillus soli]|uniref:Homoserine kinase n=1 Tax=Jeotgalibacillus soli TaxID=889306 RepID=A0A0C2R500_9BACL|nr:homoserine kinase [Jeotgalibacillus soli]KIL45340.1 homoserine kinase [Jeotgalibacillus soli]
MTFLPFSVKVPATSANLGPGFDSLGIAIDMYQTVKVMPADKWTVRYENVSHQHLSVNDDNLIMSTIRMIEERFQMKALPAQLVVHSSIPLARGMGSSAAAIAAGIEIADHLLTLNMTPHQKVTIASEIEGHPDNVSAAILGGITVSRFDNHELDMVSINSPDLSVVLMIPSEELSTILSRGALPEELHHKEAACSSAASNVMVAAILTNDWITAGRMMEKDQFHEPYRTKWLHSFSEVRDIARSMGAYGSTISGAGPSILILCPNDKGEELKKELTNSFSNYLCVLTKPSSEGITNTPFSEQNLTSVSTEKV